MNEVDDPILLFGRLFAFEKKSDLERFARTIVISQEALVAAAFEASRLGYAHFPRHAHDIPESASITERDIESTRSRDPATRNDGLPKLRRKVANAFREQKCLSAHLFRNAVRWHCVYFTNHDVDERSRHWEHGPHVHFVNDLWPRYDVDHLEDFLFGKRRVMITDALHIRYRSFRQGWSERG